MRKTADITHFAPELHIPNGTKDIDFTKNSEQLKISAFVTMMEAFTLLN